MLWHINYSCLVPMAHAYPMFAAKRVHFLHPPGRRAVGLPTQQHTLSVIHLSRVARSHLPILIGVRRWLIGIISGCCALRWRRRWIQLSAVWGLTGRFPKS